MFLVIIHSVHLCVYKKRKEAFLSTELWRPLVLKEIQDKDVFTENIYISKIEINKRSMHVKLKQSK